MSFWIKCLFRPSFLLLSGPVMTCLVVPLLALSLSWLLLHRLNMIPEAAADDGESRQGWLCYYSDPKFDYLLIQIHRSIPMHVCEQAFTE